MTARTTTTTAAGTAIPTSPDAATASTYRDGRGTSPVGDGTGDGTAETHTETLAEGRLIVDRYLHASDRAVALARDVLHGLTDAPRQLPPKWFYDATGGLLFEEITRLPEYYPTRAEQAILDRYATDIAAACPADTLIELGSGSSAKTRVLLDALRDTAQLRRFVPFDVDETALTKAGQSLLTSYPQLSVHAVVGDFERHLPHLPGGGRRLIAFLGGTLGNLRPDGRQDLLGALREQATTDDALVLGTDLVKEPDRLVAAYDDGAGITAAFNRNVLSVINRELGADFDVRGFAHVALWNGAEDWIEMRLRAIRDQQVSIPALDLTVDFERGEDLLTEISAKFTLDRITAELSDAGWTTTQQWTDPEGDFVVTLATPTTIPTAAPV